MDAFRISSLKASIAGNYNPGGPKTLEPGGYQHLMDSAKDLVNDVPDHALGSKSTIHSIPYLSLKQPK